MFAAGYSKFWDLAAGYPGLFEEGPEFDKAAIVKILLEHGADVNTKDEYGKLNTIIVT